MKITSNAFIENGMIPSKYTCDDKNISPQFSWSSEPVNTKSFALICSDPDAPSGDFVHWVIYNIPAGVHELAENIARMEKLADGSLQGLNSAQRTGYTGPCPPSGVHRYYFRFYALDVLLDIKAGLSKADLLKAIQGHILAEGELMGKYQRSR
ncbi:MAG: YbhB/YbcL family Raf kinase inhibitor-like protein [Bacteroidia bacterium]|nr:YbhB/YbcL family Raf kinase inhibitor-like protein [Bacteroidia bacterium]